MRRYPGEIVRTTAKGVVVRYSPSQGSNVRYRVTCPHGKGVNARTQRDALEDARDPGDWCGECAEAERHRKLLAAGDGCVQIINLKTGELS